MAEEVRPGHETRYAGCREDSWPRWNLDETWSLIARRTP
jgi:hypothetical protein